ncbi:hypothetical protein NMY22_g15299 [Coprinellus aureogranulatus]|nr:hypothetical protein NMY22_g15299 [Coprinellus aureogranulatus]
MPVLDNHCLSICPLLPQPDAQTANVTPRMKAVPPCGSPERPPPFASYRYLLELSPARIQARIPYGLWDFPPLLIQCDAREFVEAAVGSLRQPWLVWILVPSFPVYSTSGTRRFNTEKPLEPGLLHAKNAARIPLVLPPILLTPHDPPPIQGYYVDKPLPSSPLNSWLYALHPFWWAFFSVLPSGPVRLRFASHPVVPRLDPSCDRFIVPLRSHGVEEAFVSIWKVFPNAESGS